MNEQEIADYIRKLESTSENERFARLEGQKSQSSLFQTTQMDNLAQWQLELDNIIERIDHLLRGHEIGFDNNGRLIWKQSDDPKNKILTEYGVQEILKVLSMYLNRNTILSNYDEQTIKDKVYDVSMDLIDLIYMKYEHMFFFRDEEELRMKIRLYPIIVRQISDAIHSSYLRALGGEERSSLRKAMYISQNQNMNPTGQSSSMQPEKKWYNPFSWMK